MVTRVFGFFVMPRFSLRSLYSLHELPNRRCSTRRVERLIDQFAPRDELGGLFFFMSATSCVRAMA